MPKVAEKKLTPEDRLLIRKRIKRIKEIDSVVKPLEKEKNSLRDWLKEKTHEYSRDFDFAEGKTETRYSEREYYDKDLLDEMIDNGTFDADTAALIMRAKKKTEIASMYVI